MKKQMLYHELAKYYDLIYSWKDYKRDISKIKKLILKYKKSDGKELLDVACGTGRHLKYLKNSFSCIGVDSSKDMLKIAKNNVKGVIFKHRDMVNFKLNKKFDIIICLFSSIGYTKIYSKLRKTIKNFSEHLKTGGVLIIEGWITKSKFKHSYIHLDVTNGKNVKIARMHFSKIRKNVSVLDENYLIGEGNKGIRYLKDRHELGLFDMKDLLKVMKQAGLKAKFLKKGFTKDRGIYIGVKT